MNETDRAGRTPLHYAALSDDATQIVDLVAGGANPDAQDNLGFTALHLAAQQGSLDSARALLHAGASIDVVNAYGNTPLFVAVANSRGRGDLIELLLRGGADPRHVNNSGQTPAGLARLIANFDVAQFFKDVTD